MLCYGSITPNDSAFIAFGLLGFRKKQQLSSNFKFHIKWLLLHESQSLYVTNWYNLNFQSPHPVVWPGPGKFPGKIPSQQKGGKKQSSTGPQSAAGGQQVEG